MNNKREEVRIPHWFYVFELGAIALGIAFGYFLNFWTIAFISLISIIYLRNSIYAQIDIYFLAFSGLKKRVFYVSVILAILSMSIIGILRKLYDIGTLKYIHRFLLFISY